MSLVPRNWTLVLTLLFHSLTEPTTIESIRGWGCRKVGIVGRHGTQCCAAISSELKFSLLEVGSLGLRKINKTHRSQKTHWSLETHQPPAPSYISSYNDGRDSQLLEFSANPARISRDATSMGCHPCWGGFWVMQLHLSRPCSQEESQ